jgi:hypothetical protein
MAMKNHHERPRGKQRTAERKPGGKRVKAAARDRAREQKARRRISDESGLGYYA